MRWVSANSGGLLVENEREEADHSHRQVSWADAFKPRAVHELLFDPIHATVPSFLAMSIARHVSSGRQMVWIDPSSSLYPPAIAAAVERLHMLRARPVDLAWAAIECLRCRHVGAVIAVMLGRPTRVDVRRLQLAAEHGEGIGILLRPDLASAGSHIYAATTRWLVSAVPGERTIQRWRVEQRHGHGRHFGESFIVEKHRAASQANLVPLPAELAHHPKAAAAS